MSLPILLLIGDSSTGKSTLLNDLGNWAQSKGFKSRRISPFHLEGLETSCTENTVYCIDGLERFDADEQHRIIEWIENASAVSKHRQIVMTIDIRQRDLIANVRDLARFNQLLPEPLVLELADNADLTRKSSQEIFDRLTPSAKETFAYLVLLHMPLALADLQALQPQALQDLEELTANALVDVENATVMLRRTWHLNLKAMSHIRSECDLKEARRHLIEVLQKSTSILSQEELALQRLIVVDGATTAIGDYQEYYSLAAQLEESRCYARAGRVYLAIAEHIIMVDYQSGNAKVKWQSIVSHIAKLTFLGHYEGAKRLLESIAGVARQDVAKSPQFYLAFLLENSRLHRYLGDFNNATKLAEEGLSCAEALGLLPDRWAFLAQLATLALLSNDYQKCLSLTEKALPLNEVTTESTVQLQILRGHAERALGRYQQALQYYQAARIAADSIGYRNGLANIEQSLGIVSQLLNQHAEALAHFQKAYQCFDEIGNPNGATSCRYSIAQLRFELTDLVQSLQSLKLSVNEYRRINNRRDLCDALLTLGRVELYCGFRRDGLANVRFALWMAEDQRFTHLKGLCHWLLFRDELRAGNLVDARLQLEKGLLAFQELELRPLIDKAEFGLKLLDQLQTSTRQSEEELQSHVLALLADDHEDSLEILTMMAEAGLRRVGEENLGKLLAECLEQGSSQQQLSTLRGLLLLGRENLGEKTFQRYNADYLQRLTKIAGTLQEPLLSIFLMRWQKHYFSTLSGDSKSFEHVLIAMHELIMRFPTLKSKRTLARETLECISKMLGTERVVVGIRQLSVAPSLAEELHQGLEESGEFAADFFLQGLTHQASIYNPRRDPLLFSTYKALLRKQATVQLSKPDGGSLLMVPIRTDGMLVGFLYSDSSEKIAYATQCVVGLEILAQHLALHLSLQAKTLKVVGPALQVQPVETNQSPFANIIHTSKIMRELISHLAKIADVEASALISGESGTGKDLIAKTMHDISPRRSQAFVTLDCGAINEELFESICFGYLKGAFTGAHEDRAGYFQLANGGTLYLDNIDTLSLANQAKLLRALQEGEIRRLGSTTSEKIDIRVLASTSKDLNVRIEEGRFRADLFFRLDVLQIHVPALRTRKEDILPLINHIQQQYFRNLNKRQQGLVFTEEAYQLLLNHRWPGNIRELQNEIERLVLTHDTSQPIAISDLSAQLLKSANKPSSVTDQLRANAKEFGLHDTLIDIERRLITAVLARENQNISRAANALNLERNNLKKRMRRLGLSVKTSGQARDRKHLLRADKTTKNKH